MKDFATRAGISILLTIIPAAWAQEQRQPGSSVSETDINYIPFGKAFSFPLSVQCVVEARGQELGELDGFAMKVEAAFLGPDKVGADLAKSLTPTGLYADENWFRYHTPNQIKYIKFDLKAAKYDTLKENAWQHERDHIQIAGKPLHKFGAKDFFGSFTIRSGVKMQMKDVIKLGTFDFQPRHPGLYRINLWLYRASGSPAGQEAEAALFESKHLHVYFDCPDYQPSLSLAGADTIQLRDFDYEYLHTPIVNGIFFEEAAAPTPAQNPTDRIFLALLYGRAVIGLPCHTDSSIQLVVLPDPLYALDHHFGKDYGATLELSRKRAERVKQELEGLAANYLAGRRCGAQTDGDGVSKTNAQDQNHCQLKFDFKEEMSGPSALELIKWKDSVDEPEKYRQENRVVALNVARQDERRLFEPLTIKQNETPDYLQLRLRVEKTDALMDRYLEAGWIILRSVARGDSVIQKLSEAELAALRSSEITLFLDKLKFFTARPGDYEVQVALRSACDATVRYSRRVRFHFTPKAVLLDEIFALSPFDRADFSYDYDRQRLPDIVDGLFQKIEAATNASDDNTPVRALVLISGHTDMLSEHRGAFYNLGLSFERAEAAKQKLQAQILITAQQRGFKPARENATTFDTATVRYMSKSMRRKMSSPLYAKTTTQDFFKTLRATATKPPLLAEYYRIMKEEKRRHFLNEPRKRPLQPQPYALAAVDARLEAIDDNVICGMTTIAMRYGQKPIRIDMVTAGFGAAIPFYRKFTLTDTLRTIFCAGGLAPDAIPQAIFADDDHPSGRVMNRRIEVSLIVDKAASEMNGISRKTF